jgi:hypothetical protein
VPKDASTHEQILKRYAMISKVKEDFADAVKSYRLAGDWKLDSKLLMLSYAKLASPEEGKHATGYALDIKGKNADIKRIARSLGATMAFDEGSHVHCEWRNGVDTSKGGDHAAAAERAVEIHINRNLLSNRHFHCLFVDDEL